MGKERQIFTYVKSVHIKEMQCRKITWNAFEILLFVSNKEGKRKTEKGTG